MSVIKASRLHTYQTKTTGKYSWPLFCPLIRRPRTKEKLRPDLNLQRHSIQSNSESLQTDQHLSVPSGSRWRTPKYNRVLSTFHGETVMARSQFWIYFFFLFFNNANATTHPRRPEAMLTAALPPPSYWTIIHPCSQEWHKNKHVIHKYLYTACPEQHSASL